jgi:hypothetical protein
MEQGVNIYEWSLAWKKKWDFHGELKSWTNWFGLELINPVMTSSTSFSSTPNCSWPKERGGGDLILYTSKPPSKII